METLDGDGSATALPLCDTRTGRVFKVRPQPSDIDACVSLSFVRCVLSIAGILLVLTDIPRTGLAINLFANLPKAAPGTAMYYGPYAYPVAHLNRSTCVDSSAACDGSVVAAFAGEDSVDSVELWAYKFDSLSIPTRALAEYLNVSSYPRCVFYEKTCESATLTPSTTFSMLNDLMAATQQRYFADPSMRNIPVVFETVNCWADRLHHMIIGRAGYRLDRRIHSVHNFATHKSHKSSTNGERLGLNICQAHSASDRNRPMVCSLTIPWWADHPTLGPGTQITLEESISLRFSGLQQQYPESQLEMALITTRSLIHSHRVAFLPAVYYLSDNVEITTLIRGTRCLPQQPCMVEFVDDYRYERATLEASSEEIKFITGTLRAVSQSYIWLRVALLIFISFKARLAEESIRTEPTARKLVIVALTVIRIPSHIIVYGSWFPIIAYSAAHFMDCGLVHMISENFWSTSNGFFDFNLLNFIALASIQMRNVWLIALVWKGITAVHSTVFTHRNRAWRPKHGLLTFRGVFVGMISFLTIFSFLRALRFRDSKVIGFSETPRHAGFANQLFPPLTSTVSDFGHFLDFKVTIFASIFVCGTALMVEALVRCFARSTTSFLACHTFYVPLSAGKLYPVSALNVFWYIRLIPSVGRTIVTPLQRMSSSTRRLRQMTSSLLSTVMPGVVPPRARQCDQCTFVSTPLHWRSTQGCVRHEKIFSVGARSLETQSMIRLVNIGMLSDPIVFISLRLLGRPLFLHRVARDRPTCSRQRASEGHPVESNGPNIASVHTASADSYVLTPAILSGSSPQSRDDDGIAGCEFVAIIDSRRVPWTLLVDCG